MWPSLNSTVYALTAVAVSTGVSATALAQEAAPKSDSEPKSELLVANSAPYKDWLTWNAPPECPDAGRIQERVAEWLGGPIPSEAALSVAAAVSWEEGLWTVRVQVDHKGHSGERRVRVESCADAADFVALTVVLAVDPTLVGSLPDDNAIEPNKNTDARTGQDQAVPDEHAVPESERDAGESKKGADAKLEPESAWKKIAPYFGAGVAAAFGPLPKFALGPSVEAGVAAGRWETSLFGHWSPGRSSDFEEAKYPLKFSLWEARARMCPLFRASKFRLGPCASAALGAIGVREESPLGGRESSELWGAVGVGASLLYDVRPRFSVLFAPDFLYSITAPRFVVAASDPDQSAALVHQPGSAISFFLGVRIYFPPG